jgi:hypothetical protein
MKYASPELTVLGSAAEAIQGTTKSTQMLDSPEDLPSVNAYEADE